MCSMDSTSSPASMRTLSSLGLLSLRRRDRSLESMNGLHCSFVVKRLDGLLHVSLSVSRRFAKQRLPYFLGSQRACVDTLEWQVEIRTPLPSPPPPPPVGAPSRISSIVHLLWFDT